MKKTFLIVGAGLFGATFARLAAEAGYVCNVYDKRRHVAGNAFTSNREGIQVHEYGPHIFHTSNDDVWRFVNQFAQFNGFTNRPKALAPDGEFYSLPINLATINKLKPEIKTPKQAQDWLEMIKSSARADFGDRDNLECWAISQVGIELYERLIRGYTKKQWNRDPSTLPSSIIKRLPVRFTWDDNYFEDKYQGIPIGGYTEMVENMLDHHLISTHLGVTIQAYNLQSLSTKSDVVVFSGCPGDFYSYNTGALEYRSLRFEHSIVPAEETQGNAIINYTDEKIPYTRSVEHKYFDIHSCKNLPKTVITKEFPIEFCQ
jgi:UDP-galactopyranose mutase